MIFFVEWRKTIRCKSFRGGSPSHQEFYLQSDFTVIKLYSNAGANHLPLTSHDYFYRKGDHYGKH